MNAIANTPLSQWMGLEVKQSAQGRPGLQLTFQEHHIGNPMIRSLHGGALGTLLEAMAEHLVQNALGEEGRQIEIELTGSTISFMRVTKDADLFASGKISRLSRRIAFVETWCWQDDEDIPVARASCQLRIIEKEQTAS